MGKSGSGGAEIGRQVVSAKKTWVQTERAAHEAWAGLIARAPRAAMLLHHFVALMGEKTRWSSARKRWLRCWASLTGRCAAPLPILLRNAGFPWSN